MTDQDNGKSQDVLGVELRKQIIREVEQPHVRFPIVKALLGVLRIDLQLRGQLGLADDEDDDVYDGGGLVGNVGAFHAAQRRLRPGLNAAGFPDAAIDALAAQEGANRIRALVDALPHLDALYPDEAEREQIRADIRRAVADQVQTVVGPPVPAPTPLSTEELQAIVRQQLTE